MSAFGDPDGVTVGSGFVAGVGLRVLMHCDGKTVHMSPAGARTMAGEFESPMAKAHGLQFVADALREFADRVEAELATKQ